jgi:cobalt-zinc-cadmium efflux system protein
VRCGLLAGGGANQALAQSIQDSALPRFACALALSAQGPQLPFQALQLGDTRGDVRDVLIEQRMRRFAVVERPIAKAQQPPDLGERHVERAAVANERQPLQVRATVKPVVAGRAGRLGKQAFALVIADGFARAMGAASKVADSETRIHGCLTLKLLQGFHYTPMYGHGPHDGHGHHRRHGRQHGHEQAQRATRDRPGGDTDPHVRHHDAGARRLMLALGILGSFTLVEAVGGYLANSIALLAEAAHMLGDSASLVLAVIAVRAARRAPDERRTYGHRRYQPLAAFVNGQLLLLLTAWVVYEAIVRLVHVPEVKGGLMLAIALMGGAANLAAFLALSGGRSLNERAARAHVLSDLLGSTAASAAAVIILSTGWQLADPLLSLVVSALILRSAWSITRASADVLLEGVPAGFEVKHVEAELLGHVTGLVGVHHVHVWSMTGERPTVTLHANLAPGTAHGVAIAAIHARLEERLYVEHTTVQIEEEGACGTPDCGPARRA